MIHTDYAFYVDTYKGKTIPSESEFASAEVEASAYVNGFTRGKANNLASIPDEYYLAICAVAEVVYRDNIQASGKVKASESVGNHSVSYVTTNRSENTVEMYRKAMLYLKGTGLTYSGMRLGGA